MHCSGTPTDLGRPDPVDRRAAPLNASLTPLQQHFISNFGGTLGDVLRAPLITLLNHLRRDTDKKASQTACSDGDSRIMFVP